MNPNCSHPPQVNSFRATHTLSGRRKGNTFRLGDRFQVTVDLERRELDFRLMGRKKGK